MKQYTGREIAIFTDSHALLEPIKAALQDIANRNIKEIYSLGDNIGLGPNPSEVLDLLEEYNVKSIAGNSEDYITLGLLPFTYFNTLKEQSRLWTLSKLNERQIGKISLFPYSIELLVGGKKLALCHFANDIRIDYIMNSTWSYQRNIENGMPGYGQFFYTNSTEQFLEIEDIINKYGIDNPFVKGYLSSSEEPLFKRKKVDFFDAVVQGHVHWKIYEKSSKTDFYSIRAVGMAYGKNPVDTASYVILKEHNSDFDMEEVLVKYDRDKMISSILSSDNIDQTIRKFVNIK